LTLFSSS